jgi:hypothetical protein
MPRFLVDEREHRRGLVLGLTLAEVLILLLFLLLLALGARLAKLHKEASDAQASLAGLQPLLEEVRRRAKDGSPNLEELVAKLLRLQELERTIAALRTKASALDALGPDPLRKAQEYDALMKSAANINPNDPPAVLKQALDLLEKHGVEQLSQLSSANEELRQRNTALAGEGERQRRQIETMIGKGKGTTHPSCWQDGDGQPQYIFDVTIRDTSLVVVDATEGRANDPAWKLVEPFARDAEIPAQTFQSATRKMFDWSKGQNCRFFAIIRDGTGPTSKEPYKRMRTLVEGHFYPKLVNSPRIAAPQKPKVETTGTIPGAKKETKQPTWQPFQ